MFYSRDGLSVHRCQKSLHSRFLVVTVKTRYLNTQCLDSSSHTRLGVENGVARTANRQSPFANTCLSVKNSRSIAHPGVLHRARFKFSSPSRAFSFPSAHSDNLLVEKEIAVPIPSEGNPFEKATAIVAAASIASHRAARRPDRHRLLDPNSIGNDLRSVGQRTLSNPRPEHHRSRNKTFIAQPTNTRPANTIPIAISIPSSCVDRTAARPKIIKPTIVPECVVANHHSRSASLLEFRTE